MNLTVVNHYYYGQISLLCRGNLTLSNPPAVEDEFDHNYGVFVWSNPPAVEDEFDHNFGVFGRSNPPTVEDQFDRVFAL